MRRLLLTAPLLALPALAPLPSLAQSASSARASTPPSHIEVVFSRADAMPAEAIPVRYTEGAFRTDAPTDSLSEGEVLRRISRTYGLQSELLLAQANADEAAAEALLEEAMASVASLLQQPGIMERPRFRELYRSVVTEYERYYGVIDTLSLERGDIFAFHADAFAAIEDDAPTLGDIDLPVLAPMHTVFPMTQHRLVEQSMAYLMRSPEKHLYRWLERAETYFPMIEQILAEEGVPDELKYLAMIESGLNPTARSWASAGGMWQFIGPTGAAYGLDIDTWVDERLDPEKATRAAARHLKDLHKMFGGDWQLALAGYNCSPARIRRAIRNFERRTGRDATFWDIYDDIPRETRGYVPMFIATSLIASNPDAFPIADVEPGPRYEYDLVPVHGMMPLDEIAEMAGTNAAAVRALNPELRRGTTPPTAGVYHIRLPLGTYERFAAAYAALPVADKATTAASHTVRRGDALGKIAGRYGTTTREIMQANGLASTVIHPGQTLVIPVRDYRPAKKVDFAAHQPARVQYGSRLLRPIAPQGATLAVARGTDAGKARVVPASTTPTRTVSAEAKSEPKAAAPKREAAAERTTHTVRRGDTLGKIAGRYGVSIRDIQGWNNLRGTTIRSGQRLAIHGASASAEKASTRVTYRVRRGDTLGKIAGRYGVSVRDLQGWNSLRSTTIRSGQRLTIYTGDDAPAPVHTVQRGDTLGKIASRYGVSVRSLQRWNDLRGTTIRPGQRLKVSG